MSRNPEAMSHNLQQLRISIKQHLADYLMMFWATRINDCRNMYSGLRLFMKRKTGQVDSKTLSKPDMYCLLLLYWHLPGRYVVWYFWRSVYIKFKIADRPLIRFWIRFTLFFSTLTFWIKIVSNLYYRLVDLDDKRRRAQKGLILASSKEMII